MLTTRNKGNESCNTSIIDGVPQPSSKKSIECTAFQCSHFDYPKTESILEMVFDYDFSDSSAFRIINFPYFPKTKRMNLLLNICLNQYLELPLSVASLTFNENTVNILIDHGVDMHAQNSYGDTVLHSLVKYSAVYPNKTDNVIDMFKYLNGLLKKGKSTIPRSRGIDSDIYLEEDSYVWSVLFGFHVIEAYMFDRITIPAVKHTVIKI
jgi:hypothetical protein